MRDALKDHWPEYLMEAAGLGIFMIAAAGVATLLEYPGSPIRQAIEDPLSRRIVMGVAMGLTAIGIIYSPWGQRSGAHINPAITLTFFRLGKVGTYDTIFYVIAQFLGGLGGVLLMALFIKQYLAHPTVNFVVTIPGAEGVVVTFLAEFVISFFLMLMVLYTTNTQRLASFTGVFAGLLVATYVIVESPYSGFSMNPARSFASALPAGLWTGFSLYMIAPPLGMLLAAELYLKLHGIRAVICAKLHHQNSKRCIFNCGYASREA